MSQWTEIDYLILTHFMFQMLSACYMTNKKTSSYVPIRLFNLILNENQNIFKHCANLTNWRKAWLSVGAVWHYLITLWFWTADLIGAKNSPLFLDFVINIAKTQPNAVIAECFIAFTHESIYCVTDSTLVFS